jgi:hypothetical protein
LLFLGRDSCWFDFAQLLAACIFCVLVEILIAALFV